jgi:hypothetical protein
MNSGREVPLVSGGGTGGADSSAAAQVRAAECRPA